MSSRFLQLFLLVLVTCAAAWGQEFGPGTLGGDASALAERPERHFLDFGEHFFNEKERADALNDKLVRFSEKDDFAVYVVAYSGIIGSDVATKANQFRDNWLGDETEGLVFVCDTDMKALAFALTRGKELSDEGKGESWRLPDHEVLAAIGALETVSTTNLSHVEYLEALSNRLIKELDERLQARKKKKGGIAFGYILVFLFTVGLVFSLMRYSQNSGSEVLESESGGFPSLEMTPRLGAQFAGGVGAEIQFAIPPPENPS